MIGNLPQRKPNRLKNFNYSSVNYYFVTVCAKNRKCYFGKIENQEMRENKIGKLLRQIWMELDKIFTGIELDIFVIMPNHFHGILIFNESPKYRIAQKPATLSQIIGAFKSKTNLFTRKQIFPDFSKINLWQKTFYDRVIRNDADLEKIREYICNNALKWELDDYYR